MAALRNARSRLAAEPRLMRRLNGWLTLLWLVMIPISVATGWIHSVTYVAVLSLWALVAGHWAAWVAGRVEVAQAVENARRASDPLEERIVHHFLKELGEYLRGHAEELEDIVSGHSGEEMVEAVQEAAQRTAMM